MVDAKVRNQFGSKGLSKWGKVSASSEGRERKENHHSRWHGQVLAFVGATAAGLSGPPAHAELVGRKLKGYVGEHVKGYLSHGKIRSAQLPQALR